MPPRKKVKTSVTEVFDEVDLMEVLEHSSDDLLDEEAQAELENDPDADTERSSSSSSEDDDGDVRLAIQRSKPVTPPPTVEKRRYSKKSKKGI